MQNCVAVPNYFLRDIDPELWRKVKARAAFDGRPIRFVILELLKVYAEHGYTVVETFDGKKKK